MRSAVAERHAEALRRAHRDIRAVIARRLQQREREQIGRHRHLAAHLLHQLDEFSVVVNCAERVRVLHQRAKAPRVGVELARLVDHQFNALRRRARAHHVERLRMARIRDKKQMRALVHPHGVQHGHRLGRGGRLVEQRRVRDGQAGQVRHHGLEIQQRLQPALRDLRLVRRVGRIPSGILQDVALDDRRRDRVVVALADEGAEHLVLLHHLPQLFERRAFGPRRGQVQRALQPDGARDGGIDQRLERLVAQLLEHARDLVGLGPNVAPGKRVQRRKRVVRRFQRSSGKRFVGEVRGKGRGRRPGSGIEHSAS